MQKLYNNTTMRTHRCKMIICLGLILALLSSCASTASAGGLSAKTPPNPKPGSAAALQAETRVYLRQACLLGEEKLPEKFAREGILGSIAGALIDKAIGFAISGLRTLGDPKITKTVADRPTYLYQRVKGDGGAAPSLQLNPGFGCVILIHGTFSRPDASEDQIATQTPKLNYDPPGLFTQPDQDAQRLNRLTANGIPIATVDMLTEVSVVPAADNTAVRYVPKFLWAKKLLNPRENPPHKLALNINIVAAGGKPDEPVISSGIVNFGKVSAGSILGPASSFDSNPTSPWVGGIGLGKDSAEAFKARSTDTNITEYMPVTFVVAFVETADGYALAKFFADLLEAGKKDITKLANETFNPDERAKTATAEATDQSKLEASVTSTYKTYLAATATLKALPAPTTPPTPGAAEKVAASKFDADVAKKEFCKAAKAFKKSGGKIGPEVASSDVDACAAL